MADQSVYKEQLLQHYRHPHNRQDGPLSDADIVRRGSNPRCGDEIEVGLYLEGDRISEVRFRGRGCSVCIASSSMMAEAVSGREQADVVTLCDGMRDWFNQGEGTAVQDPPASLSALAAVREYPARRRCVLLSWEALADALEAV
jgi:nitrogen fixation NifU-like protein